MNPNIAYRRSLVAEFHKLFHVPVRRTFYDVEVNDMLKRHMLLYEESRELADAKTGLDVIDAYCDIEYIAAGTQDVLHLEQLDLPTNLRNGIVNNLAESLARLNDSTPCQRKLTSALSHLRCNLDMYCPHLHEAFLRVHETNMKKQWTKEEVSTLDLSTGYKEDNIAIQTKTHRILEGRDGLFVVLRVPDGKIIKPPSWVAPDLTPWATAYENKTS